MRPKHCKTSGWCHYQFQPWAIYKDGDGTKLAYLQPEPIWWALTRAWKAYRRRAGSWRSFIVHCGDTAWGPDEFDLFDERLPEQLGDEWLPYKRRWHAGHYATIPRPFEGDRAIGLSDVICRVFECVANMGPAVTWMFTTDWPERFTELVCRHVRRNNEKRRPLLNSCAVGCRVERGDDVEYIRLGRLKEMVVDGERSVGALDRYGENPTYLDARNLQGYDLPQLLSWLDYYPRFIITEPVNSGNFSSIEKLVDFCQVNRIRLFVRRWSRHRGPAWKHPRRTIELPGNSMFWTTLQRAEAST